mgnify:CR=1 FL=1
MIGLCFHHPGYIVGLVNRKRFRLVSVFNDHDLPSINGLSTEPDDKEKLLFISDIDRLLAYVHQEELQAIKILVFDSPHNFFRHRLIFSDANQKSNGIWSFRLISKAMFKEWFDEMRPGLELETDPDLEALPWSYND